MPFSRGRSQRSRQNCKEEQERFEIFFEGSSKFLTKAARQTYDYFHEDNENDEVLVAARLRSCPRGAALPDLFVGDSFTVAGKNCTIQEIYWGYKEWVNRDAFGSKVDSIENNNNKRSAAATVAFVILTI